MLCVNILYIGRNYFRNLFVPDLVDQVLEMNRKACIGRISHSRKRSFQPGQSVFVNFLPLEAFLFLVDVLLAKG
jgi:hypothetical protein